MWFVHFQFAIYFQLYIEIILYEISVSKNLFDVILGIKCIFRLKMQFGPYVKISYEAIVWMSNLSKCSAAYLM